jgi:SAM-dependent methyltransferase
MSTRPSLEHLLEREDLGLEILHPGGLELTRELAELCHVGKGFRVLDVASGTGRAACFLANAFGCDIIGVDASASMVERATRKYAGLSVDFRVGDAHDLPFGPESFDAVISECSACLFRKERAIDEMVRVAKHGGYVGIHDVCWHEGAPDRIKEQLADLEGERPETIDGWKGLFEGTGLVDVMAIDKGCLLQEWSAKLKKEIGLRRKGRIFLAVLRRWGFRGVLRVVQSEKLFRSRHLGYGIIVGRKVPSRPS